MAEVLASYLQNMLMEMAKEEMRMLIGVPSEMSKMDVKLRDLKKFLADADRRNITDETVKGWVIELRGAMYDASDILDLCQLKAMKRGPSRDMGCFNPLLYCIRNPLHAHDIGNRLRKLNEKLDDIEKRSKTFDFKLTSFEEQGRNIESSQQARRETLGDPDKFDLVGKKVVEDTRNLVELLTANEKTIHVHNKVMVFAIVGVGGIGKTTLARNIFNNEIIKRVFQKKIWLSVNQNFEAHDLLARAITEAGGDHQAARNEKAALFRTLKKALEGNKTLVVMDDVWDYQAWESVLQSPLEDVLARGSRVLVTTRNEMVARGMMAEKPYHHIDKLEPEDAWILLKNQVVNKNKTNEPQVDMLKDVGMDILAKCDGLPIAVKVMGGLLRQKEARQSDWQNVLNDSTWSVSKMPEELTYAIYLSFHDMDPFLKHCFLHFSLLPKSTEFSMDEVVGMWISEGFVPSGSHDLERVARDYYDQLILRNLIEPDVGYIDHTVCNMHDIVRSFAQYVDRDEALAGRHGRDKSDILIDKLNSQKFLRLSLETHASESEGLEWMSLQTQVSLRTLILVGPIKIKSSDSLVTFSSLRTLHMCNINFDALSKSLVQLKHLRYLSIEETDTSSLPENIGNMKFLQYISLLNCHSLLKLPDSIGELGHLRFLNLVNTQISTVHKGFNGLSNMRKLYGFPTKVDGDWCSLEELGPLSKLIDLRICGLEKLSDSTFARKTRLCEKVCIRYLSLECTSRHGDEENILKEQQQIKDVFDELRPPPFVENLEIYGYFGQQLPVWMTSTTIAPLQRLRILSIENLPCCMEIPDSLYQLQCLEFLKIQLARAIKHIGPYLLPSHHHSHPHAPDNLCSPVKVEVHTCPLLERISSLYQTQKLTIIECRNITVLKNMPALQELTLEDYVMETLPTYLRHVNPRLLKVYCNVSLLTLMAAGQSSPEWVRSSHIQQVKAYADDDDNNISNKWYVLYTRYPFSFETNISLSAISKARSELVWKAYGGTCPMGQWTRYAGVEKRQPLCQRFRCNAYRHLVLWLQKACLHCCEARRMADSSDQWTEATTYCAYTRILRRKFA